MRHLGHELATQLTVLAILLAIVLVFPYDAISFKATKVEPSVPFAAFVMLSPDQEAAAIKAAKTSWIGAAGGHTHSIRAELPFGVLPDAEGKPVLTLAERPTPILPAPAPLKPVAYLPSAAAPAPVVIPHDPRTDEQPFSRQELLKLD